MAKDFTVTLIGKGGKFKTMIHDELDFATHPYEVCLQEMIFTPGSWGNVRSKANWFIVYDKLAKKTQTLFLPPGQYSTISDILYGLNRLLADNFGLLCDMFFYCDRKNPDTEIVFPQPLDKPDENLFRVQSEYKRRLRKKDQDDKASISETPGMKNKPEIIQYGGGKDTRLTIQFCPE